MTLLSRRPRRKSAVLYASPSNISLDTICKTKHRVGRVVHASCCLSTYLHIWCWFLLHFPETLYEVISSENRNMVNSGLVSGSTQTGTASEYPSKCSFKYTGWLLRRLTPQLGYKYLMQLLLLIANQCLIIMEMSKLIILFLNQMIIGITLLLWTRKAVLLST